MTKGRALQKWFGQAVHNYRVPVENGIALDPVQMDNFLPAYPADSVPKNAILPYLTYTPIFSAFGEGAVSLTVHMWFHTDLNDIPNAAAQEFSRRLGPGGKTILCDGGRIWLKRGSPFSQSVTESDRHLKGLYINITAEYLTSD